MIKIIKDGKTDFRMTCDKCGCVFEYNVADIEDCYIKCPTCRKPYYAFDAESTYDLYTEEPVAEKKTVSLTPSGSIIFTDNSNPCEGCPTYIQLTSPEGYIGDTPCQWCNKNP
jgi:hypothetical protein